VLGAAGPSAQESRRVVYVSTVGIVRQHQTGQIVDESYEHPGPSFLSEYEKTIVGSPPEVAKAADRRRASPV